MKLNSVKSNIDLMNDYYWFKKIRTEIHKQTANKFAYISLYSAEKISRVRSMVRDDIEFR